MGIIDPDRYAALKVRFCAAIRANLEPGDDWFSNMSTSIAIHQFFGLLDEHETDIAPYISLFAEEVKAGLVDPYQVPALAGFIDEPAKFTEPAQPDLLGDQPQGRNETERTLIEQLIAATKIYDNSEAIRELFAFTIRLRAFAPFNAMLLHIQKPGLTHAASAQDWWRRFGRVPKKGTRPLLILRTKGPVDFVFDILDTEGRDLPVDAFAFPTFGAMTDNDFTQLMRAVSRERINVVALDAGDGQAGWIRLMAVSRARSGKNLYQLAYNRNHATATRFVTVAHELAHLYLGHLGADAGRRVPDRHDTPHALMEVEAEMTAYLVAMRNGLKPRSESYLANYKGAFEDLNLYAVTRAANAVEASMGISAQQLWNGKG